MLEVLTFAAPFEPLLVKPPLPHAVDPGELSPQEQQLFQPAKAAVLMAGSEEAGAALVGQDAAA